MHTHPLCQAQASRGPCLPARRSRCVPSLAGRVVRQRRVAVAAVLDPVDLVNHASQLAQHLPLAYEPVALPCSLMNCGDVVHRSTLDPVLRKEVAGPDWRLIPLIAAAALYLFATPGVLPGAIDYYITGRLQKRRALAKDDFKMGKRLGAGGFGSVYKADLIDEDGSTTPVIVKKAKEFGEAEVWMNERLSRAADGKVAEFVGAFEEPSPGASMGRTPAAVAAANDLVWLVWKDEGENTLYDVITKRDFPYNLETMLLGRELRLPKGKRRRLVTLKLATRQLLEDLAALHATGIVHRDIKPQNVMVSLRSRRLVLIDLGAAADLRLGINYVPNEYLLDPRYAPPQQYIMSRQTPRPPPKPVAALLSPVLWQMERPDKFDMYSVGITMLQMAFPNLRSDNNLIAFNRRLEECGWDLRKWRAGELSKRASGQIPRDLEEGFEVLDLDNGAGWDLVCKLVTYKPSDRLTAEQALNHPWFESVPDTPSNKDVIGTVTRSVAGTVTKTVGTVSTTVSTTLENSVAGKVVETISASMEEALIHSDQGGLTEAQLAEEFGYTKQAPVAPRNQSQTIAWWQDRQSELEKQRARMGLNLRGVRDSNGNGKGSAQVKVKVNGNGFAAAAQNGRAGAGADGGSSSKPLWRIPGLRAGSSSEEEEEEVPAAKNGRNGKILPKMPNGNGNKPAARALEKSSGVEVGAKMKELLGVFAGRK